MQLTEEQVGKSLTTLNAGDALIALQLISRLVQVNAIKEVELATVGVFRNRVTEALKQATGIDFDAVVEAERQAQQVVPAPVEAAPAAPVTTSATARTRKNRV